MKKVIRTDNLTNEQWLQWRRKGIGGSDASVVLGINPYRSVQELWLDKTGQSQDETSDNESIYWGHRLEEVIRKEFAKRSGLEVTIVPYLLQHDQYSHMQANLDGMVRDSHYGNCIFEAKTASAYKEGEWHRGIPQEYYAQLQHYLAVTDWQGAYIAALIGGNHFVWKFIQRDEAYIQNLIMKEEIFWRYVLEKKKPPIDGSEATRMYLEKEYPQGKKETVDLSQSENIAMVKNYQALSEQIKILKEEQTLLSNQLKERMGEYEQAIVGESIIRWNNVLSYRFDTEEFKLNEPELYYDYCKETSYRRFEIKSKK